MAIENEDDSEFQKLLDDFIASELKDVKISDIPLQEEPAPKPSSKKNEPAPKEEDNDDDDDDDEDEDDDDIKIETKATYKDNPSFSLLKPQERNLYQAFFGLCESIKNISDSENIKYPKIDIDPEILIPNYKPSIGRFIADLTLRAWNAMIEAYPIQTSKLSPIAPDNELLSFAENCNDTLLTLAVISYVETLIEIEGCEIEYESKRLKALRKKLEKEIIDEHQRRLERIKKYVKMVEKAKYPVDADRLINNFFKASQKDPKGAFAVLTSNPAVFAPIDFSKIKPRFFGLMKVTPEDGIRINKKLANFLKFIKA